MPQSDLLDQLEADFALQRNADNDKVRFERRDSFESFARILGLSSNGQVGFLVEQLREPCADHGMFPDQQDRDSRFLAGTRPFRRHGFLILSRGALNRRSHPSTWVTALASKRARGFSLQWTNLSSESSVV